MQHFLKNIARPRRASWVCAAGLLALSGCGGGTAESALTPTQRATIQDDSEQAAPHLLVALRVTPGGAADEGAVRLLAVTYDMDGQAETTELGSYVGTVMRGEAEGAELIRVAIENGNQRRVLRLVRHDGFIEAHRTPAGGEATDDELILRIPVRQGVRLMLRDPAIETENQ